MATDEERIIREQLLCMAVTVPMIQFIGLTARHLYATRSDGLSETYTLALEELGVTIEVKYVMYVGTYVSHLSVRGKTLLTNTCLHCDYHELIVMLEKIFTAIYNTTDLDKIKKINQACGRGYIAYFTASLPIFLRNIGSEMFITHRTQSDVLSGEE